MYKLAKDSHLGEIEPDYEYTQAVELLKREWQKRPLQELVKQHQKLGDLAKIDPIEFLYADPNSLPGARRRYTFVDYPHNPDSYRTTNLVGYLERAELYLTNGEFRTEEGMGIGFVDVEASAIFMALTLRAYESLDKRYNSDPRAFMVASFNRHYIKEWLSKVALEPTDETFDELTHKQKAEDLFILGSAAVEAMFLEFQDHGLSTEF